MRDGGVAGSPPLSPAIALPIAPTIEYSRSARPDTRIMMSCGLMRTALPSRPHKRAHEVLEESVFAT
jgi:hypothetical protein